MSSARAPLWGVGQRLFFLHDGRTSDLLQAIRAHEGRESEANGVIGKFKDTLIHSGAGLAELPALAVRARRRSG